jgi:hypothetical protein
MEIGAALFFGAVLLIPILLWPGFADMFRRGHELPRWQNIAGLISLSLLLLSWLLFVGPILVTAALPEDARREWDRGRWAVLYAAVAGTLLGVTLKRGTRIFALFAGILEVGIALLVNV